MTVKQGLKKISGGVNFTHPKLSVWYILGAVAAITALFFALDGAKWVHSKTKSVVGQATPGAGGKSDIRARLGI